MAIVKNFAKEDITSITIDVRGRVHINTINANVMHEMLEIIRTDGGFTFEVPNHITVPGDTYLFISFGDEEQTLARLEDLPAINFNLKQIYQLQATGSFNGSPTTNKAHFIYITSVNAGAITADGKFAHAMHNDKSGIKTIIKNGKVLTFGRVSLPQPVGPLDYHNIYEQFEITGRDSYQHPLNPESVTGNIVAIVASSEGKSTDLIYGALHNSWSGIIDVDNYSGVHKISIEYYPDKNIVEGSMSAGALGSDSTVVELNILESK